MKYQVGDKVTVVKNNGGSYFDQFIGKTFIIIGTNEEISSYFLDGIYSLGSDYEHACWSEDELELVQESQPMSKTTDLTCEEALKLALDGHKVTHPSFVDKTGYVYWDSEDKVFKVTYEDRTVQFFVGRGMSKKDWQIYTPQPQFNIGQTVATSSGNIGIIQGYELWNDKWLYTVLTNKNTGYSPRCTEDELRKI